MTETTTTTDTRHEAEAALNDIEERGGTTDASALEITLRIDRRDATLIAAALASSAFDDYARADKADGADKAALLAHAKALETALGRVNKAHAATHAATHAEGGRS